MNMKFAICILDLLIPQELKARPYNIAVYLFYQNVKNKL